MLIYLGIFLIGFLYLVVSFIIGELLDFASDVSHEVGEIAHDLGGLAGHEGPADMDSGAEFGGMDGGHGVALPSPFNPRIIAAFATGFGGFGALALLNDASVPLSLGAALGGGLVIAAGVFFFVLYLMRQQRSTHLRRAELIGQMGTVLTDIKPNGVGEISVIVREERSTHLATSADGSPIPHGTTVRIVRLTGNGVVVTRVEESGP